MAENKIVVFDDDPTGIQTVHDVLAYTSFDIENLTNAFLSDEKIVFLSTNSRAMTKDEAIELHTSLTEKLFEVSKNTGVDFEVIIRGDSTLRGHYPYDVDAVIEVSKKYGKTMDGEIICPFLDGIRKTENDVHYVLDNENWIPCGESEFSKDPTFGYKSSDLKDYVREKTGKDYPFVSISLNSTVEEIEEQLLNAPVGSKVIVNALSGKDIDVFTKALRNLEGKKRFIARTAATYVKSYAQVSEQNLINVKDLYNQNGKGRLIFAGSYVGKTTAQIEDLKKHVSLTEIVYSPDDGEVKEVASRIDEALNNEETVLVYTSRTLKKFEEDPMAQLQRQRSFSKRFTSILNYLTVKPKILVSKGGITSYDVLSNGLQSTCVYVLGQVYSAVPVVRMVDGPFKDLNVIVFPGNVGQTDTISLLMK